MNPIAKCSIVLIMLSCFALGCSHNKPKADNSLDNSAAMSNDMGSSDTGNAMGLQTIHFPYDSSLVDSNDKVTLTQNADILKSNPTVHIQVEGYCDNRGGIQYNIALGEKRAQAVKHFLQDHGVKGNRVTVISFGKEKPVDPANTEEAYAKNRRANFVITSK
jgi:peptidoglycan-associated lipoprotein